MLIKTNHRTKANVSINDDFNKNFDKIDWKAKPKNKKVKEIRIEPEPLIFSYD
jgi:hypothetical protein